MPVNKRRKYDACVRTPFAILGLCLDNDVLVSIDFLDEEQVIEKTSKMAAKICRQIQAYCTKQLPDLHFEIEVDARGTRFQKKVWKALMKIPAGQVTTYGELARQLGTSARAVGNACRSNPVPLVIPCHRVIAKSGPGGYAGHTHGPELETKLHLLAHEGVQLS